MVTIPIRTARGLGLEKGDRLFVGYYAEEDTLVYTPASADFEGW